MIQNTVESPARAWVEDLLNAWHQTECSHFSHALSSIPSLAMKSQYKEFILTYSDNVIVVGSCPNFQVWPYEPRLGL